MSFDINNFAVQNPIRGLAKQAVYIKRGMPMSQMHRFQAMGIFNEYAKCKSCGKRKDSKFHI